MQSFIIKSSLIRLVLPLLFFFTAIGGHISISNAQTKKEEQKIKAVETIFKAFCESEQKEAHLLRSHLKYISDLSVQKFGFQSEADAKAHADQLKKRRQDFLKKIWSAVEKQGQKKSEISKVLKKIDLYSGDEKILEKAKASCSLTLTEKLTLLGELT